jgi:2'-5' RNA ligase
VPSGKAIADMFYAIVHYLDIDTSQINQLRKKFDPQADLIAPHITVVFPVPESVGEQRLASHIDSVVRGWQPFPIRLKGLLKSWDDCLFLLLADGSANVIALHDEFYTGPVAQYRREDIPFIPHVTLGVFTNDADLCAQVMMEAERMELDYQSYLDRLHLVKINDDRSRIVQSKEFLLRG